MDYIELEKTLKNELNKYNIPYEIKKLYTRNVYWIPRLCSNATPTEPLMYISFDFTFNRIVYTLGITQEKRMEDIYTSIEITSDDFHSHLANILRFYFENIDKTP